MWLFLLLLLVAFVIFRIRRRRRTLAAMTAGAFFDPGRLSMPRRMPGSRRLTKL